MNQDIFQPTETILANHKRWRRNRDVIAGEDTIKSLSGGYLPRLPTHDRVQFPLTADQAYRDYIARTPFFPASSRVLQGLFGMIFRLPSRLKTTTALVPMMDTITVDGHSVADLAEDVVAEVLTTNYCGLYVDHPAIENGMSKAQAEAAGVRPFVYMYRAESILEVTPSVINNRRTLVRVRVLDNETTVREMILKDGVYQVIIHTKPDNGGQITSSAPIIPTKGGQPLTEIPFNIVSTKARSLVPTAAVMDDVCSLNVQLFHAQAKSANLSFHISNPLLTIKGVPASDIQAGLGNVLFFPEHSAEKPVDIKYVQADPTAQQSLDGAVSTLKEELAIIGSRILAPDTKAGVESAESLMLRKASEFSVLGGHTRTIARGIKSALDWVAWWMNAPETEFELNLDFYPAPMTAADRKATVEEWMSGLITKKTALELFKTGEILPSNFDVDAEIEAGDAEALNADRPVSGDVNE